MIQYNLCLLTASNIDFNSIPGLGYDQTWLTSLQQNHIVISIQACEDAWIALSRYYGNTKISAFEIGIGMEKNKKSVIGRQVGGPYQTEVETPGILSCNESLSYWVRWTMVRIEVGTNAIVGDNRVMSLDLEDYGHEINAVAFHGGTEKAVKWTVHGSSGS